MSQEIMNLINNDSSIYDMVKNMHIGQHNTDKEQYFEQVSYIIFNNKLQNSLDEDLELVQRDHGKPNKTKYL